MDSTVRALDVGATSIKAALLGEGAPKVRTRRTRPPVGPEELVDVLLELCGRLGPAPATVVGFCGPVADGVVLEAANLDPEGRRGWVGFDLAGALRHRLAGPVEVLNDADLAALGAARGVGLELTVTLGTGVGTGLTRDGRLEPHREFSHLAFGDGCSPGDYVGEPVRKHLAPAEWDRRVVEVLERLDAEVRPDALWLAGGNAPRVTRRLLGELGQRLWVCTEPVGLLGAARLVGA
jgi:polyphosphate glucokinase